MHPLSDGVAAPSDYGKPQTWTIRYAGGRAFQGDPDGRCAAGRGGRPVIGLR